MEKETSSTQEVEIPLAKRERKHSSSGERVEVDMKNGLSTHEVSTIVINRLSQCLQIAYIISFSVRWRLCYNFPIYF